MSLHKLKEARQAGREAYDAGKSIHSAPRHTLFVYQEAWLDGWYQRRLDVKINAQQAIEREMHALFDAIPCDATRAALEAIWEKMDA